MWPFSRKDSRPRTSAAPLFFTNTLSGAKEPFAPLKVGVVNLYSCGPTVYGPQHIGNMRAAVFADLVARLLTQAGFRVRRVINITDVGHLVSDGDDGEDKMEKGARESGASARDIAERYTRLYMEDIRALNVQVDEILFPRATDYIKEQIALVQTLEKQGHTYRISDGIYFDVSTFPGYGKLGGVPEALIKEGTVASLPDRVALANHGRIKENKEKRHPADFALWKFSPVTERRQQEWSSPWGRGFPGWHLECSAMIKALLGETIDIHTGGIEHIPVHHNGEIAQSESTNGKPLARYWLHQAHLMFENEKISKSLGNSVYLSDIVERGLHPLALRYFFMQAHYKSSLSFSWDAIAGANEALARLWKLSSEIKTDAKGIAAHSELCDRMVMLLRNDLGTPQALALLWETVRDDALSPKVAWGVIETADKVLGLLLTQPPASQGALSFADLPEDVRKLVGEREAARTARDFTRADELRIHIENRGYAVEDTADGPAITRK